MDIGSKIIEGRYIILEKLGQGAFGEVFRAQDQVGGITVAIKTIPDEVGRNETGLTDFRKNFQLIHALHHPHIAAPLTLEFDKTRGKYLLIMEFVDGVNLAVFRKSQPERKVPIEKAVRICRQIADALDFAHKKSILHRDIKPENVHITAKGDVKILDFGLASEIRSTVLKFSRTIGALATAGTRPYMAPEQFEGKPPGPGVDHYALGVLFYELISGELPFQSDDVQVLMNAVCHVAPTPLEALTKAQNFILLRMLAKNPAKRFPSAGAFVSALEKTLEPSSKAPKIMAMLAGLALVGGVGWYILKPPPVTPVEQVTADLFQQMLRKKAAIFRNGIGIVPSFLGCTPLVYNQSKTALIRSASHQGWDILVRKDLQAIVDDQGMVNYFKTGKTNQEQIKLSAIKTSQSIVVGNCVEDELHLRVIDTNSVALAAASGSLVEEQKKAKQGRYIDNRDGTIEDTRTGLIGLKNANCFGKKEWEQAKSAAANLASGSCGLTDGSSKGDWRLPTKNELETLMDWQKSGAFSGVQTNDYWSSTASANSTSFAWYVSLSNGYVYGSVKTNDLYVWPVRGGQ